MPTEKKSFFPWNNRGKGAKLEIAHRINSFGRLYHIMTDGSRRRVESDREIRRVLGLSPRQFRKAKRAERRGEYRAD